MRSILLSILFVFFIFTLNYPSTLTDSDNEKSKSLTFVFEYTSLIFAPEPMQVFLQEIEKVLNTLSEIEKKTIKYYGVVLGVDGHVVESLRTENQTDLKNYLSANLTSSIEQIYKRKLRGDSAGTTGTEKALILSLSNSIVYVFINDGSSFGIQNRLNGVLDVIKQKKIQVVLVNTGSRIVHEAFSQIATISGGKVFEIFGGDQLRAIFEFIRLSLSIELNKVTIWTSPADLKMTHGFDFTIPFDESLKEIMFLCTFPVYDQTLSSFDFIDPSGQNFKDEAKLITLLNLTAAFAVKIKDPTPGNWNIRLNIDKPKPYAIYVTGQSDFDFNYEFHTEPIYNIESTRSIVYPGPSIYISPKNFEHQFQCQSLEIVNTTGYMVEKLRLNKDNNSTNSYFGRIIGTVEPNFYVRTREPNFYVRVKGTIEGRGFQRISNVAISTRKLEPEQISPSSTPLTTLYSTTPSGITIALQADPTTETSTYYPAVEDNFENTPPKGLVYVLDCGPSITPKQLQQFKEGVANISKTLTARERKIIQDWSCVLAVNGHMFQAMSTSFEGRMLDFVSKLNLSTIADSFNALKISNDSRFWESSDSGIQKALSSSAQNSIVYVFAFDYVSPFAKPDPVIEQQFESILRLIYKKKIQITFTYTGIIETAESYKMIANVSGGKVFQVVSEEELDDVFKFIQLSLPFELNKVTLYMLTRTPKITKPTNPFLIDNTVKEIIITCIFNESDYSSSSFQFQNPTMKIFVNDSKLSTLLNLTTAIAVKLEDPAPGTWSVSVDMAKPRSYTLYVTGTSGFDVNIGFSDKSQERIKSLRSVEPIPRIGVPNNIFLSVNTASSYPATFDSCDIMNFNATTMIDTIPVNKTNVDNLYYAVDHSYYTNLENINEQYFHVRVKGKLGGKKFQRMSNLAFRATRKP